MRNSMLKKKVITILLTVIVFLSAAVLGISTVYRVKDVNVRAQTISQDAEMETTALRKKLKTAYYKQSIFFTDDQITKEILKEFPYLRLISFERAYPDLLVVRVAEDAEVFATAISETEKGYYILNAEGTVLGQRENYINRAETDVGGKNILLSGKDKGEVLSGQACMEKLFPFCQKLSSLLGDKIRANVLSVETIAPTTQEKDAYFCLQMHEGVRIYLFEPTSNLDEKLQKAIEKYFSLSDGEKMTGRIAVMENASGLTVDYSGVDSFQPSEDE